MRTLRYTTTHYSKMYRVESYESSVSLDSTELSAIEEDKANFESADSIEKLQELTIGFLLGEKSATAYHFGPLLAESAPLVGKLIALNNQGFITTNSQPGGHESMFGRQIEKRSFVEGILPRQFVNIFLRLLYTRMGEKCFAICLDSEMLYEEIKNLQKNDLYWVTRYVGDKSGGLLHISEFLEPCQSFQTCSHIYPHLAENYVTLFIMDTRWGNTSSELLETMFSVIQTIRRICWT